MFVHRFNPSRIEPRVAFDWFLLCFNAGCINAGGFLATGRFVSHMTGFSTLFGVEIVRGNWLTALGFLSVLLFFQAGAFLAGMFIERPLHLAKPPRFDLVMALSSLCLFAAVGAGEAFPYTDLGEDFHLRQVYLLIALLCLACGLQNGAISSASGSALRSTHMTGYATDVGLGLARLITLKAHHHTRSKEGFAFLFRLGCMMAFIFGSVVGSWFYLELDYRGFFVSGLISLYAAWHGHRARNLHPNNETTQREG